MKNLLIISILLSLATTGFAQKKIKNETTYTISRAKLSQMRSIQDLAPFVPADVVSFQTDIVGKCNKQLINFASNPCDKTKQITHNGNELSEQEINLLKSADIGSKIWVDIRYLEPKAAKHKIRAFSIRVTE